MTNSFPAKDRHVEVADDRLRELLMNGLALIPAGANVVMQLSNLAVGRGVLESVSSPGALYRHPIRRTRTTLSFIMIALLGTESEREQLRLQIDSQHRHVRSGPDSPVAYDALSPELQLWVAVCMYQGLDETVTWLYGDVGDELRDSLFAMSSRFATTLQVDPESWPADRRALDEYWRQKIEQLTPDDEIRTYLLDLVELGFLPKPLRLLFGPIHRFFTVGFLPPTFRTLLGVEWTAVQQKRFCFVTRQLARLNKILPAKLRALPWNVVLYDARRRLRHGRLVVA